MKNIYALILVIMFIPPTFVLTACGSSSNGGSNKPLNSISEKDFQGRTFSSDCITAQDSLSGARSHYFVIDFFTKSFSYTDVWHKSENCSGTYAIAYTTSGTFSVPADIPATENAAGFFKFDITSSYLMAASTEVQDFVNGDCGNTSPYFGKTSAADNGAHKPTYEISCRSVDFPGTSNHTVLNSFIANGETLQIITPYTGIPGQFAGKSLSGEPVTLH